MIKNYLKIAWRNLLRNRLYSLINIFGLGLGMAVAILIGLWIRDELTFNRCFAGHAHIAQVMLTPDGNNHTSVEPSIPMPLGNELRSRYGHYFKLVALTSWEMPMIISVNEKKFSRTGLWVEPDFPAMMTVSMLSGNYHCLTDPSSLIISESLARALFGAEDPMNKLVKISNKITLKIGGVYRNIPDNASFHAVQMFLPWSRYITTEGWLLKANTDWGNTSFQCFVALNSGSQPDQTSSQLKGIIQAHEAMDKDQLLLFPMDKWRLYSRFDNGKFTGGAIGYVWLFGIIGLFVLMLACINFMNLSTATSERRRKEVGVRKAMGSSRKQLVWQFLSESVVTALIAALVALSLVICSLPAFSALSGKSLHFPAGSLIFWTSLLIFTGFIGVLAGSYPAFYLSKFNSLMVAKPGREQGRFSATPRKILVVFQYTVSITIITGTAIVYQQIQFAKKLSSGYDKSGLITIQMNTPDLYGHYDAIRNNLLLTGVVQDMAESSSETTSIRSNTTALSWPGKEAGKQISINITAVTPDFGTTIGWKLVEGRDFQQRSMQDTNSVILNEAATRLIGFKDPIGRTLMFDHKSLTIVGVVKNLIMDSPYQAVKPGVFTCNYGWTNVITLRIKEKYQNREGLAKIEYVFRRFNPGSPFEYQVNSQLYNEKFSTENQIGLISMVFSVLAIIISSLGLFGLAAYVASQRTKEIGIRKVLGASVLGIWTLISREFILLVGIACMFSMSISWFALRIWLQRFEYHTGISLGLLFMISTGAIMLTLITTSFQAIRAATTSPTKSLKTE